jgi:hypothetical protein
MTNPGNLDVMWPRRFVKVVKLGFLVRLGIAATLLGLIVTGASVGWVRSAAGDHTYTESTVRAAPVALVLGTQVYDVVNPRRS